MKNCSPAKYNGKNMTFLFSNYYTLTTKAIESEAESEKNFF